MHHTERLTYGIIIVILIGLGLAVWALVATREKTTQVFLGNTTYSMKVAQTDAARNKLLLEGDSLKSNKGVLVAYSQNAVHAITLNNISQPTDALWLDEKKTVVYQIRKLPVARSEKKFGPNQDSRYLLLFPAGVINQQKTKIGSSVSFDLNSLW